MLGVIRLLLIFAVGRVFGVGLCWMFVAPCSSLILLMLEKEIRLCFVASWFGMVFSLVFHVDSVVLLMVMVVFFGECTFPPLLEIRENREFHDLMRMDRAHWPRCLLWHGWLPMLSGVNGVSPWAAGASESAGCLVEVALGQYSSGLVADWSPSDEFDEAEAVSSLPDHPNVWTDGSLVLDRVTGVSSSGSGFFAHQSENCWSGRRRGHVDGVRPGGAALS